jgi:hypothetical protein
MRLLHGIEPFYRNNRLFPYSPSTTQQALHNWAVCLHFNSSRRGPRFRGSALAWVEVYLTAEALRTQSQRGKDIQIKNTADNFLGLF